MREAIAQRYKITVSGPMPQRETAGIRFDTNLLGHAIARKSGLVYITTGQAITQIPIDRRLF
ncbi:MAG: hypothetical protein AWT59_2116 [Candidatus Gallionella acididurans]|uniref:Uncharacterized protein n=1 Tax=Candidatus Gallionella acididurans TaxID=1796491 RepID=A0A139BRV8_9PROT|nr:MAG: hypothetical protein AWT59_2116 [Candidatus Gallionella acididurans]